MPIDLLSIREDRGGDPERQSRSEAKRGNDPSRVQHVLAIEKRLRKKRQGWEAALGSLKDLGAKIREHRAQGTEAGLVESERCVAQLRQVKAEAAALKELVTCLENELNGALAQLGNLVSELDPYLSRQLNDLASKTQTRQSICDAVQFSGGFCRHLFDSIAAASRNDSASLLETRRCWFKECNELPRLFYGPAAEHRVLEGPTNGSALSVLCIGDFRHSNHTVYAILCRALSLASTSGHACVLEHLPAADLAPEWSYAVQMRLASSNMPVLLVANGSDYWCRQMELRSGHKQMNYVSGRKKFTHLVQVFELDDIFWKTLMIPTNFLGDAIDLKPPTDREIAMEACIKPDGTSENQSYDTHRTIYQFQLDLDSESLSSEHLSRLEVWLRTHSFIGAHAGPSEADHSIRKAISESRFACPPVQFPCINRWLENF